MNENVTLNKSGIRLVSRSVSRIVSTQSIDDKLI